MNLNILYHQVLVSPHVGGAAKLAMNIHEFAVDKRGAVSRLLIPGGGDSERIVIEEGFPFAKYNLDWLTSSNILKSGIANLQFFRLMKNYNPAILHFHSPFIYGASRPFLQNTSIKRVLHIHLDYSSEQLRWSFKLPPDLLFVAAKAVLPMVIGALPISRRYPTKVTVLQNAVDVEKYFPTNRSVAKRQLNIEPDVPLALIIANLAPHKGHETALKAIALLKNRGHTVKLMIVGGERDGDQGFLAHLRTLTKQLEIDKLVEFLGFRKDVPDLLRAADFLLLPSKHEALPLVVLEAQASKVVVLASPAGDLPDVIEEGETGYLIGAENIEGYADRIAALINNHRQMKVISENAYEQIQSRFKIEDYFKKILNEYDGLLQI